MRLSVKISIALTSLVIFVITSCTKDSAPPEFGNYPTEIGKIMTYKCATSGCHNTASAAGSAGLDLSSYSTLFKGSSNGSPVIPFRSDFSSLCYFINTYDEFGPKNIPTMPLNGTALSKNEVKTIKDWIDQGAPDIKGNVMWSDDPKRKKYYVLNQGCDVVTVFDAKTQLPIRYITVGNIPGIAESPHMVKMSHDGNYWYVIFVANNILQKFRASDDVLVAEIDLGKAGGTLAYNNWNTLTISNDDKRAYLTSWQANSRIATVDLPNMRLLHNFGGLADAHGTALNVTQDTLYITKQTGNYIYKIDTGFSSINTVVLDVPGSGTVASPLFDPHEIVFSPDGSRYFVSCQGSNEVRVMQTVGDVFITAIATGQYPSEMVISPKRNTLYASCSEDPNSNPKIKGSVSMIDMTSYGITNYKVGYEPHGIGIDEANNMLIVANRNILVSGPTPHHTGVCGRNGFLNYFNINTMELLGKKTEVAADPYSLTVRP
jgi:DNA-binding beta-propeller fold protein YncE